MKNETVSGETGNARLASMIGLCRRAGRLGCGVDRVQDALKAGRASLVLLASDPTDRSAKQVTDKCRHAGVPLLALPMTGEAIGRACGIGRVTAAAVGDPGFARAIAALAGGL